MIFNVVKQGLYLVGSTISALLRVVAIGWLVFAYGRAPTAETHLPALYIVYALAFAIAVVVHEFGHLLACLAVGAQVRAFRLGDERSAIRFRARTVALSAPRLMAMLWARELLRVCVRGRSNS
ncbi:MAG TPA: hypothetical protein VIL16_29960 [Trebonia sp.]